mgnify:FL=1
MKEPLSLGPVSTGSLLSSSEGLSMTGMLTLVTTICTGDYPEAVQQYAILGLGIASGLYALARGLSKKNA